MKSMKSCRIKKMGRRMEEAQQSEAGYLGSVEHLFSSQGTAVRQTETSLKQAQATHVKHVAEDIQYVREAGGEEGMRQRICPVYIPERRVGQGPISLSAV